MRERVPEARLLLVGAAAPRLDLDARLASLGLAGERGPRARRTSTSRGSGRCWPRCDVVVDPALARRWARRPAWPSARSRSAARSSSATWAGSPSCRRGGAEGPRRTSTRSSGSPPRSSCSLERDDAARGDRRRGARATPRASTTWRTWPSSTPPRSRRPPAAAAVRRRRARTRSARPPAEVGIEPGRTPPPSSPAPSESGSSPAVPVSPGRVSATATIRPRGLARAARRLLVNEWAWLAGLVARSAVDPRRARRRSCRRPGSSSTSSIYSELAKSIAEDGQRSSATCRPATRYGLALSAPDQPRLRALRPRAGRVRGAEGDQRAGHVARRRARLPDRAPRCSRRPRRSLGAALSLAPPALLYSGMLMTENAFYPAFLLAALLLVRALERPTWPRARACSARSASRFSCARRPSPSCRPRWRRRCSSRSWSDGRGFCAHVRIYAVLGGARCGRGRRSRQGRSPRERARRVRAPSRTGVRPRRGARTGRSTTSPSSTSPRRRPVRRLRSAGSVARSQPREVQVFVAVSASLVAWFLLRSSAFASRPRAAGRGAQPLPRRAALLRSRWSSGSRGGRRGRSCAPRSRPRPSSLPPARRCLASA